MTDEIADILEDAGDYIEAHGWVQHVQELEGMVCVRGAVNRVTYSRSNDQYSTRSTRYRVASALAQAAGIARVDPLDPWPKVMFWNDTNGRTKQQVLDALRLAAKNERMSA